MGAFEDWAGAAEAVDAGGLRVAAHDTGDRAGPVATFLHGYPSSSLDVQPLLARLPGVRMVTLDLPGFGASAKPVGHPYSIHGAADAVEAVWRHAGVTATVLAAHDYGVSVAQELLARQDESPASRPVEITGVVWSNGGLWPDLHFPTPGQALLLDPEHGAEVAAAMTEELFARGIGVTWGTRRPMTDAELHDMWVALAHDGGNRQAHALLHYVADRRRHADRWRAALEGATVPLRFVWGDLDPVSGAHVAERIAERLPAAPLVRLADVGHWPPLEAPDEVAAAVIELTG
ncbi:MAG TPA: alpha/beta hydrolase [Acidimicrobiales bacterium]|nr:alpha/beta hydrolase [Acidimicrobiales bacterium]